MHLNSSVARWSRSITSNEIIFTVIPMGLKDIGGGFGGSGGRFWGFLEGA
jgi:hypothetical protein